MNSIFLRSKPFATVRNIYFSNQVFFIELQQKHKAALNVSKISHIKQS